MVDLVKSIEEEIKRIYKGQNYTYLEYEFTAMKIIERLKMDGVIDDSLRRDLLVKFANKAEHIYNEALLDIGLEDALMDEYDISQEELLQMDSIIQEGKEEIALADPGILEDISLEEIDEEGNITSENTIEKEEDIKDESRNRISTKDVFWELYEEGDDDDDEDRVPF